jgi:CBS domain-containing protein
MHTGAYARRTTGKAIELCLLLEDALMNGNGEARLVRDHMVKEPICIESWQPVVRARQLMLTHSFSNLPILLNGEWLLLTDMGLSRYLRKARGRSSLGAAISDAAPDLGLQQAPLVAGDADVRTLVESESIAPSLWLVVDEYNRLIGVISAFELM